MQLHLEERLRAFFHAPRRKNILIIDGKNPREHAQLISSFLKCRPLWGLSQSTVFVLASEDSKIYIQELTIYTQTILQKVKKILPPETVT
jgi:hypothetical protein